MDYKEMQSVIAEGSVVAVIVRTWVDYNDQGNDHRIDITDRESQRIIKGLLEKESAIAKAKCKKALKNQIAELNEELKKIE